MSLAIILVGIIAFWIFIDILSRKFEFERYNIDVSSKIVMIWRTERFLALIDGISNRFRKIWEIYANIGVFFSLLGMISVLFFMTKGAFQVFQKPEAPGGVQVVIPGVTFPLWYSLIALAVVIVVHEFSHGIVARTFKVKLKSVGLALFIAIPAAFVEPDEDDLKAQDRKVRVKIYAAGSMGNFLTAFLAHLILALLILPSFGDRMDEGVEILEIIEGMPSEGVLQEGMIIHGVNGEEFKTLEEFQDIMAGFKPKDIIILNTDRGDFEITLTENPEKPSKGFIGISIIQNSYYEKRQPKGFILIIHKILIYIREFNLGIGLINLLPLSGLLDGGKILFELLEARFSEKIANSVSVFMIIFCLALLIANLLPNLR
ncbi:MAG: site-2 protease family protein [Candidatus Methanofastidiosia archaeon]